MDALRWGIAGTGSIAASMAASLAALGDATVVAVGSRSTERALAFGEAHGISHTHGSYDALFQDPEVDVVYVATTADAHCELTLSALAAGKHVLCEKPLALDAEQARRMAAGAAAAERFLMEAMWTWFLPPIRRLHERVRAGDIGDLRFVQSTFALRTTDPADRLLDPARGGGAMLDLGVYSLALSRLLLGRPVAVQASGHLGPGGADTHVAGVLTHAGGALSTFHAGLEAFSPMRADVVGTRGIISLDPPFHATSGFTVRAYDADPMVLLDPADAERVELPHRGLAHQAEHVMQRVRAGALESDVLPLATSIELMETLDEVRRQIGA